MQPRFGGSSSWVSALRAACAKTARSAARTTGRGDLHRPGFPIEMSQEK